MLGVKAKREDSKAVLKTDFQDGHPKVQRIRRRGGKEETEVERKSEPIFSFQQPIPENYHSKLSMTEIGELEEVCVEETSSMQKIESNLIKAEEQQMLSPPVSVSKEPYDTKSVLPKKNEQMIKSVVQKLGAAVAIYNSRNTGIFSSDVEVRYAAENLLQIHMMEDGRILLPCYRVFYRGFLEEWDRTNEVRVKKGREIELDLGVSFVLPDNYELELSEVSDLKNKFGMEMCGGIVRMGRQEAFHPIVIRLSACDDLAYLQKYRGAIQARVINT